MIQHRLKRTVAHRLSPTLAQTVLDAPQQEPIQVDRSFPPSTPAVPIACGR